MEKAVLIMAGGRGERFWPRSRARLPKQFLSLSENGRTLIQMTVERISPFVSVQNIYISTNIEYRALVSEQLPQIPAENILCESIGRNTAPCIGLGAIHIRKRLGDALMIVLPSDHSITNVDLFLATLQKACDLALEGERLVTLGITPTYPNTGFGYIKYARDERLRIGDAYAVERFVEKPNLDTARKYLSDGQYLWNSGMFIWKASTILTWMAHLQPKNYELLTSIEAAIGTDKLESITNSSFLEMESISIDYGIMEKANSIYTLPGSFGWDDVGSWLAIERMNPQDEDGNVLQGDVIAAGTRNSTVLAGKRLVAVLGVQDLVVVDTDDVLLICSKAQAEQTKKILEQLRKDNRQDLL